jgi:hypothetical protein
MRSWMLSATIMGARNMRSWVLSATIMGARSMRSWVLSATQRSQFAPRLTPRDVMGSKARYARVIGKKSGVLEYWSDGVWHAGRDGAFDD